MKRMLSLAGLLSSSLLCLSQPFTLRDPAWVAGLNPVASVDGAPTLSYTNGLHLWHKADAITGTNNGVGLGCWIDSSGNNYHSYQGTTGNRPVYNTNIANGLPAIYFNAPSAIHFLYLSNCFRGLHDMEVFFVLKIGEDPSATNRCLWDVENSGNGGYTMASGNIREQIGTETYIDGGTTEVLTDLHLYHAFRSSNEVTGKYVVTNYVNTVYVSGRSNAVSNFEDESVGIALGGNYDRGSGGRFWGYISEVIVYNHHLSAANAAVVRTYLDQKYALPYTP